MCAGDERFLEAEGAAVMQIRKRDTIISLTGSVPLHPAALEHLAKDGVLVYLDVDLVCVLLFVVLCLIVFTQSEILRRCNQMKVDRIIGQASTVCV